MLRQLGYACDHGGEWSRKHWPHLRRSPAIVMLDHAMPAMTGLQTAAAMRERGFAGPIILATGYAELSELEQHELTRLQGVLNKPYSIQDLETLLERVEESAVDVGLQPVK